MSTVLVYQEPSTVRGATWIGATFTFPDSVKTILVSFSALTPTGTAPTVQLIVEFLDANNIWQPLGQTPNVSSAVGGGVLALGAGANPAAVPGGPGCLYRIVGVIGGTAGPSYVVNQAVYAIGTYQ